MSRTREGENDAWGTSESWGKTRRTDTTIKGLQQWSIPMDVGAWPGDGGQGVLIRPE
jgi:hypothetical protein